MNKIPILSLNDPKLGTKLFEAFKTIGFVAIENYDNGEDSANAVSDYSIAAAYSVMKLFFSKSKKHKSEHIVEGQNGQIGYTPFGVEKAKDQSVPDLKEFYQLNSSIDDDLNSRVNDISPHFERFQEQLEWLSWDILSHLIDEIIDKDGVPEYIKNTCRSLKDEMYDGNNASVLRLIHYPPTGENIEGVRSAAHEDINLITILPAASAAGLQVLNNNNEWVDAPTDPNLLIVNVGDMLQELTGGLLKSTTHRVINTEEGKTESRYSIPYFYHPKSHFRLSNRYTAGEYLDERLKEIGLKK